MAGTFTAQVRAWSEKAIRNMELVAKDAAQTTFEQMTVRQASITETGTFEIGKVPVDTGNLVNTQIASINGAVVNSGNVDYSAVIAGMGIGDTVQGAFTADYARHVEYGTANMPGRFFVREAVMRWQANVDAAAAKFKD